ncbi:hypothetical protein QWM81_11325 [Streptomyces ficellus]|uniref:DUF4913 domain-containing protein n=1 Tax=Streptomyces ficellus TaxID=1977088 RepID=A0ABT7Z553_9ACTN|nr:hypothetical protein [Streptomyces ficellus]MDN3294635.1 hypothetical protein [Streptomyces ficellus]
MSTEQTPPVAPAVLRLAQDVEAVRQHREKLEALVRAFATRVKNDQREVEEVLREILARLDTLERGPHGGPGGPGRPGPSAASPPGTDRPVGSPWSYRATERDWRDLAAWVDWLSGHYAPQLHLRIWPCWPAHGGVTEELAGLRAAWLAASEADAASGGAGQEMAYWHQMWLWPTLERIRQNYMFKGCESDHSPDRPGRLTDQAALEARIDASSARRNTA